jgi:hypothetical protein
MNPEENVCAVVQVLALARLIERVFAADPSNVVPLLKSSEDPTERDAPPPLPPVPFAAAVILPFASTVMFVLVYDPAVTPVLGRSKVMACDPVHTEVAMEVAVSYADIAAAKVTDKLEVLCAETSDDQYKLLLPSERRYCPADGAEAGRV